jgi:hypothetical protein
MRGDPNEENKTPENHETLAIVVKAEYGSFVFSHAKKVVNYLILSR